MTFSSFSRLAPYCIVAHLKASYILIHVIKGMTVTINYHLIHYKCNVPFMFIKPWFLKKRKSSFFMSRLPRFFLDGPHFSSKWALLFGTEPIQKSIAIKCQMVENTLYHQSKNWPKSSFKMAFFSFYPPRTFSLSNTGPAEREGGCTPSFFGRKIMKKSLPIFSWHDLYTIMHPLILAPSAVPVIRGLFWDG